MRLSFTLFAVLFLIGAGCSNTSEITQPKPTEVAPIETAPVACTMDAKACPDGSYVGRVAPKCEFAPCLTTKPTETKPVEQAVKPVETKPTETKSVVVAPVEKPKEEPAPTPTGPKIYTMAEVQAAAATGQCLTIINGGVYNLSTWISKHPGGAAAIQSLCGINGTAKFMAMHGGAPKQEAILATYKVGIAK